MRKSLLQSVIFLFVPYYLWDGLDDFTVSFVQAQLKVGLTIPEYIHLGKNKDKGL